MCIKFILCDTTKVQNTLSNSLFLSLSLREVYRTQRHIQSTTKKCRLPLGAALVLAWETWHDLGSNRRLDDAFDYPYDFYMWHCVSVCACVVVTVWESTRDAAWRAILTLPGQRRRLLLLPCAVSATIVGRYRVRPCGQQLELEHFQCALAPGQQQRPQSGAGQQMLREVRDSCEQQLSAG